MSAALFTAIDHACAAGVRQALLLVLAVAMVATAIVAVTHFLALHFPVVRVATEDIASPNCAPAVVLIVIFTLIVT